MRKILPFTLCAALALSYFAYPGTTGIAWYFALCAVFTKLIALIYAARVGFNTDPWYRSVSVVAHVFNVLWLCSIQYEEYVWTHYALALVLPFGIAAMFLLKVQKFIMQLTGK